MRFHPEKSLFELDAVRWIALTTFMAATFLSIVISSKSQLLLDLTYSGFNDAIEIFRFPLGILALGLSLIGICGANHRSEQTRRQIERTATQIELTRSQNNFANYYKHIEEFEKYCGKISNESLTFVSTRDLYRQLFEKSRLGDFSISTEKKEGFREALSKFIRLMYEISGSDGEIDVVIYREGLYELLELRKSLLLQFSMSQTVESKTATIVSVGGREYSLFDTSYAVVLHYYCEIFTVVNNILQFDIDYATPQALTIIKRMDLSGYRGRRINLYAPEPLHFDEIFDDAALAHLLQ